MTAGLRGTLGGGWVTEHTLPHRIRRPPQVADFNLSRIMSEAQVGAAEVSTAGGATNPKWLAPEILRGGRASTASDV